MRRFAVLLAAVACSHPDYGPRRAAARDAAVAETHADAEEVPAPSPPAALAFEDVVSALSQLCDDAQSSLEKGALCRQDAMKAELARLAAGEARRAEVLQHQAEWARYVDAACSVVEETFWVDWDAGRRDDGTHDVVAWPTCRASSFTERVFFARALAGGDVAALARWIEGSSGRGAIAKKNVAKMRGQLDALGAREALDAGAPRDGGIDAGIVMYGSGKFHELDTADTKKLSGRVLFVQSAPSSLARTTCRLWPELAEALGGDDECHEEVALYYFAHAQYGRVY